MGCLLFVLGLITPRFIMIMLFFFTNYLDRAFSTWFWPTLGFFFLPTATLAYAVAQNAFDGLRGFGLFLFVLGVVIDLGLLSGGARNRKRR